MTSGNNSSEKPKKTPEELRNDSGAVHYEIKMLNDVADEIPNYPKGVIHDALVESFVIYARVLIDFLYGHPNKDPQKHDIIAREFIDSSTSWPSESPEDLKEVKKRADKLAAHLTCDRVIQYRYDKGWQITQIRNRLNEIFDDWQKKVPPDKIGEELKSYKIPSKNDGPVSDATASTGDAFIAIPIVEAIPKGCMKWDGSTVKNPNDCR
jgi:hypothetical protein